MSLFITIPSDEGRSTRQVQGSYLKRMAKEFFGLPLTTYPKDLAHLVPGVLSLLKGLGKGPLLNLLRRPELHVFLSSVNRGHFQIFFVDQGVFLLFYSTYSKG